MLATSYERGLIAAALIGLAAIACNSPRTALKRGLAATHFPTPPPAVPEKWWQRGCPAGTVRHGQPPRRAPARAKHKRQPPRRPPGHYWCTLPDGRRHGPETTWDDNAHKVWEVMWYRGVRHGTFRRWCGKVLIRSGTFFGGKKHGRWKNWTCRGKWLGAYTMHRGTGKELSWYKSGQLYFERTMKNGRCVGERLWYENGKLWIEQRGRLRKRWNDRGQLERVTESSDVGSVVTEFVDGVPREGPFSSDSERGSYRRGRRHGTWTKRISYGGQWRKLHTAQYRDGLLHGPFTSWYPSGQVNEKGTYRRNRRDGRWTRYFNTGEIAESGVYERGRKVGVWRERDSPRQPLRQVHHGRAGGR